PDVERDDAAAREVIHVLRGGELLEELDGARVPAADVPRELLQHRRRALAAPVGDGVRDLGARAADARRDRVQAAVADQVADVRRDPFCARLDELIIVGLGQVLLEHRDLLGDDVDQGAQRAGVLDLSVAQAMDGGQELEEPVGVEAHGMSPGSIGSVDSVSSRAASASPGEVRSGAAAGSGWSRPLPPIPSVRTSVSTSTATIPLTAWSVAMTSASATGCPKARASNEKWARSAATTAAMTSGRSYARSTFTLNVVRKAAGRWLCRRRATNGSPAARIAPASFSSTA